MLQLFSTKGLEAILSPRRLALLLIPCLTLAVPAVSQDTAALEDTTLPAYAREITLQYPNRPLEISGNGLPSILLTGYWPPTNEMLRQFSTNPEQNPGEWVGEDWEARGYNVYAFFPEFPSGLGRGEGDFEVDYQDTSGDWWEIVPEIDPVALITFSRAGADFEWELEGGNRTYTPSLWTIDYLAPTQPTPDLPIVIEEPPGTERFSNLPLAAIVDAVNQQVPNLVAYTTPIDEGRFLSNFIGYHGNWYRDLEARNGAAAVRAAGHIHVGHAMSLPDAVTATEVTLRVLIEHVSGHLFADGFETGDTTGWSLP